MRPAPEHPAVTRIYNGSETATVRALSQRGFEKRERGESRWAPVPYSGAGGRAARDLGTERHRLGIRRTPSKESRPASARARGGAAPLSNRGEKWWRREKEAEEQCRPRGAPSSAFPRRALIGWAYMPADREIAIRIRLPHTLSLLPHPRPCSRYPRSACLPCLATLCVHILLVVRPSSGVPARPTARFSCNATLTPSRRDPRRLSAP
ncbi:hypothetical protein BKA93DRAFT_120075 [Sparassis latifolia]